MTALAATLDLAQAAATDWEVAIVGAGPAGSATAIELARRGARVLLIDKAEFPRPKICGCCLNARSLEELRRLGLAERLNREGAPRQTELLLAAGRHRARLPLSDCRSISRQALDAMLVEIALAAGIAFLPGTRARLEPSVPGYRRLHLLARSGACTIRSRVVLAADGLGGGTARRALGGESIRSASRIGAGVIVDSDSSAYPAGQLVMASGRTGYLGLVRLEDGRLNLAAALDPEAVRRQGGPGFVAGSILDENGLPPIAGIASLPWHGTPPLTRRPGNVAAERLFALGDAAGYVEPFTGEGIAWALVSARAVAPLAAQAAQHWHESLAADWTHCHARLVRRRQTFCRIVAGLTRHPSLARLAIAALGVAPGLAGPLFHRLNALDSIASEAHAR